MFFIKHAYDFGILEKDTGFFAENIFLLGKFFWQRNGTGLSASYGEARRIFGETDYTSPTTLFGLADMTGHTLHFWVLES